MILAGLFTLYALFIDQPGPAKFKVVGTLAVSFLWVVAVDLFAESHGMALSRRLVASLLGIAAIALLFRFLEQLWLLPPLLFGALVLAVSVSGHLAPAERNASFWLFNHRLWLSAALALVGTGLFALGLCAIVATLNFLFCLALPSTLYTFIAKVAVGFIAPVSWLALVPHSFSDQAGEGRGS